MCVVAVLAIVGLTSCAKSQHATARLVDTKSSVQLLRNSAADYLPIDAIQSTANVVDRSEACNSGDPWRLWKASITLNLIPSTPARDLYEQLVSSYEEDGWESASVGNKASTLSKKDSLAQIDLVVHEDSVAPTLDIAVSGECVITDGADSDEVMNLEEAN
jgi:hypothetical protein